MPQNVPGMSDGFMLFFHQLAEKWKLDDKTFHKQSQSPSLGMWEY